MRHLLIIVLAALMLGASATASAAGYDSTLRDVFWTQLYPNGGWTLYCNERFEPGQRAGLNIEHVYPASWMAKHLGCGSRKQCRRDSELFNVMESDPMNLWPALAQYNQVRGNLPFGEIPGERWLYSSCDFERRGRLVEPSQRARGQIARAMLHMHRVYGLPINGPLMARWDKEYPVTDEELRRRQIIESLPGLQQP